METVASHWSGVCESLRVKQALATTLLNFQCLCLRRLVARSSAIIGPNVAPRAATELSASLCYLQKRQESIFRVQAVAYVERITPARHKASIR